MARAGIADAPSRTRCEVCGAGLSFHAFEQGQTLCRMCLQVNAVPAATFVPAPRTGMPPRQRRVAPPADQDDILDELIRSLEAEAALTPGQPGQQESVRAVLQDIGFGQSTSELPWAMWGFAAGFTLNVAVAKYAQVTSGAPLGEFVPAFLFGGMVAGAACAGIGWGLAKLRAK